MYDIVTIGDIKMDTFIVLPHASLQCSLRNNDCLLCLDFGKKIPVEAFEPQIAGTAANVAVGASRLGLRSAIYSVMGDDETSHMAFEHLGKEGVDTRYIQSIRGARSSFSIVLTYKGDRTLLTKHEDHHYTLPTADTRWLYLSEMGNGFVKLFAKLPALIKKKKIKLAFNPGSLQLDAGMEVMGPILKVTEVLFLNLEEAEKLLGRKMTDMKHLISAVWKLGPAMVVITDGARGAWAFDGGEVVHCPAFPAHVVEATGAGDSVGTGVVSALYYGESLADALRWGLANASSVVAHVGPQPGLLDERGMGALLRKQAKIKVKPV